MYRRGTIVLLVIMLAWTLSDLLALPTSPGPDLNAAFVIIYFGLIALCYLRSPWGFLAAIALALFRVLAELPIFTPISEEGVFFGFPWSGASWGISLYLTRFVLHVALIFLAYGAYSALQRLVLD